MASFFTPPVRLIGATTLADPHPGNAIMRHYVANRVGVNIFQMAGGVFTETQPYSDLDAVRVFHGGHIHPVTDAEVALLTAAGYAANITVLADVAPENGIDEGTVDDGGAIYLAGVYSHIYQGSYT